MRSKFFQKLFYNWQVKILCLLIAVLLYFVLVFSIQSTRTITLPVEVSMPSAYVAQSNVPTEIDLVIQGTEDQIYLIDVSKVKLKVDFSGVDREGVNYAVVNIDTADMASYIDMSNISLYTKPSQLKVYFATTGAAQ